MRFAAQVSAATLVLGLSRTAAAVEATASDFASQKFDFVVVGGGTAGLTVAVRLTEDPNIRVGVIEAGQYRPGDPVIEVPQSAVAPGNPNGTALAGNPTYDWLFTSTPQPGFNGASIPLPRGKVVGGSSAINEIVWQRGAKAEYDLWSTTFGNGPRWSFSGLLPYFRKAENWTPPGSNLPLQVSPSLASAHGTQGQISVSYTSFTSSVEKPLIQAAVQLGLKYNGNPDLGDPTGVAPIGRNVDPVKGIRSYAGNSYYEPNAARKNLVLLTGAQATKIVFKTTGKNISATGVQYVVGGTTYTVNATKEVIVSAGTFQTPHLLELSGVGNKTILAQYNIPSVLDLPGVGQNLMDHPFTGSDFSFPPGTLTLDSLRFNATFRTEQQNLYTSQHKGALTYTPAINSPVTLQSLVGTAETNAMMKNLTAFLSTFPQTPLQKVQYQAQLDMLKAGDAPFLVMGELPTGGFLGPADFNTSYTTAVIMQVHPFSRGSVHIGSSDPLAAPIINPHYFEVPFEVDIYVKALQWTQRWFTSKTVGGAVHLPAASDVKTDAQWDTYVRTHTQSVNHPIGTSAMVPLSMGGVVDSNLKVYGLQNVRVIDAGIFPLTIGTVIQQTVYAIAEQGADIIKEAWNIKAY
ncbi:alcohol oxidase [Mycena rosella]|uniref:Alcohol oxidase n=1 Tax=Mycena rosella TaxID=1033263 RepID=A0AAD7DSP6_MYCRO|nr:alcohol oxidase [Mycena rosella]